MGEKAVAKLLKILRKDEKVYLTGTQDHGITCAVICHPMRRPRYLMCITPNQRVMGREHPDWFYLWCDDVEHIITAPL